jgi:alpha-tubulin suppressor-like RCC1 family protein
VGLGGQHPVASNTMEARCIEPVAGEPPPAPPDRRGPCCDGFCNVPQRIRGACNKPDDCLDGVKIVHVGAGLGFTVLLDVKGNVWTFGSNTFGQLCQRRRVAALGAQPLANFKDYRALAQEFNVPAKADFRIADVFVGWYHVLAVTTEGFLFVWGRNDRGQLGRGHTEDNSCHLEVRTDLPHTLDTCKKARVNGSMPLPRLNLCTSQAQETKSQLVPGNSTSASAGELHSAARGPLQIPLQCP